MILALSVLCLLLALLPAGLTLANLGILRTPRPDPRGDGLVSILIPARDEEASIARAVTAALASTGVPVEVLVGDDHSTDATASIVQRLAQADPRLRYVAVPPLPEGWTGKNNGCRTLAAAAKGERLLFIDADVMLAPEAAARLSAHARRTGAAMVSGVPRQIMRSLGERVTVPMINTLLIGYLPMALMRARLDTSLGAACGQLILIDRDAYVATGGHGAVRSTLHDGVKLPRLLRAHGFKTDLVLGTVLAECRMYRGFREAWAGFSKNAHEGMATPRALPVWTLMLLGGHVLPWFLVLWGLTGDGEFDTTAIAAAAGLVSLATRAAVVVQTAEPLSTIVLHPMSVAVALAIQWRVLLRPRRAGTASWKGRRYPVT